MNGKELAVKIIAVISALCVTISAAIYWFLNITSMTKLLSSKNELTEAESLIIKQVGNPTWKDYFITYFLMLFLLVAVISAFFAMVRPTGGGAATTMLFQMISLGFMLLIYRQISAEKSKFLYDPSTFKLAAAFLAAALLLLFVFALTAFSRKKKETQKDIEAIADKRKKTNIVVLDKCTLTVGDMDFGPIEQLGNVTYYDILTRKEIMEACENADVILCNKAVIDEKIMEACPRLSYIGLFATGYNNIDVEAAHNRGITVCNAPGYSTDSVAQLTFAYILNHATSLDKYNASTHNGDWIGSHTFSYFPYPISELRGKTLSIIGYGSIGKKVAKLADAFGMKVCVCTRTKPEGCPYELVDVDEAFSRADYLTVHCPLTDKTRGLISRERLALMKRSAYLINTSRGAVADEAALKEALDNGIISGAAVDVLVNEPMLPEDAMIDAENLTLTPHVAWASYEARVRLISLVASNLRSYQNGIKINAV